MKIAFLSDYGSFSGIIPRLLEEGTDVKLFIKERHEKHLMEGLAPKFSNMQEIEDWKPDIAIFDGVRLGSMYDRFKHLPHLNGMPDITKLETERKYGLQVMVDNGIQIPYTEAFKNIMDAIEFLKADSIETKEGRVLHPKKMRWVFKQDAINVSSFTIVEKEPEMILEELQRHVESKQLLKSTPCILQEFIDGVEVDIEAFVQNGRILYPLDVTLEVKKMFASDVGASSGGAAACVWADSEEGCSKTAQLGIAKLTDWLLKTNYNGQIALNSIVRDGHVYGIEFTCRFGINASYLLLPLLKGSITDFLTKAAQGELNELPIKHREICAGIVFSLPPYPMDLKDRDAMETAMQETCWRTFICEPTDEIMKDPGLFFHDVFVEDDGVLCAGTSGLIAFNARTSTNLEEAMRKAVKDKECFEHLSGIQYRGDCVTNARERMGRLVAEGMLNPVPFLGGNSGLM